jgi:carbon-monoxide dehydrogenase small subunit
MILSAKALLDRNPAAGEEEIKKALSGVLCRCGSYKKIVEAVQAAGEKMGGKR